MEKRSKARIVIGLICLVIAGIIMGYLFVEYYKRYSYEKAFKELQEQTATVSESEEADSAKEPEIQEPDEPEEPEKPEIPIPPKSLDWEELWATNPDIYAWLYVPDTNVDYPVLQHPTDDYYYLNYNLDGTKGYPGCIYSEKEYNSTDLSDEVTVLYGHNMKNGTMFKTLHYFEEEEFFDEDRLIYIYTPGEGYAYQVFGAFELDDRHLLAGWDLEQNGSVDFYINTLKSEGRGHWKDVDYSQEDRFIILSTCVSGGRSDYRYMIIGKRIN